MPRSLAAAVLAVLLPLHSAFAQNWEKIYVDKGVTVSRADMPGTRLVGFKGDTIFDAPLTKVLYVLLDNAHRTEWVGRLYINRILEQKSPYDFIIYQAFNLPFPFSNRDYVYHGLCTRDPSNGAVTLQMNSVDDPKAPPTVGVRAQLINSRYLLTPVDDAHTRVQVEILTDPKGLMPIWLVNLIQRTWPRDTLVGIRGQLGKPYTEDMALPPG